MKNQKTQTNGTKTKFQVANLLNDMFLEEAIREAEMEAAVDEVFLEDDIREADLEDALDEMFLKEAIHEADIESLSMI